MNYNRILENLNTFKQKGTDFAYLYQYSIFFRNYIHNVPEDVLKNGITLENEQKTTSDSQDLIEDLKVQLKESLYKLVFNYRVYGYGCILIQTNTDYKNLKNEVNFEFPIGFMSLNQKSITSNKIENDFIIYNFDVKIRQNEITKKPYKIHKSRLIEFYNFDEVINNYVPCFSESFLLNVYLFEAVFTELQNRIHNYNFLFLKDEILGHLQTIENAMQVKLTSMSKKMTTGSGFLKMFQKKTDAQEVEEIISSIATLDSRLSLSIKTLKDNMFNNGILFTSNNSASLEVIKYDFKPLRDALELAKIGIGANTKEPLTRSFNEQTKGLGNQGKGDQSNYYDFLKGVQDMVSTACNLKLKKYYGLNMKFNSLYLMTDLEKIENDKAILELVEKYIKVFGEDTIAIENIESLKEKLFFAELLFKNNLSKIVLDNKEKQQYNSINNDISNKENLQIEKFKG